MKQCIVTFRYFTRDQTTYMSMTYCTQVLGKMYLMQGDYARALQSLERVQDLASSCTGLDLETISLVNYFSHHCYDMC